MDDAFVINYSNICIVELIRDCFERIWLVYAWLDSKLFKLNFLTVSQLTFDLFASVSKSGADARLFHYILHSKDFYLVSEVSFVLASVQKLPVSGDVDDCICSVLLGFGR